MDFSIFIFPKIICQYICAVVKAMHRIRDVVEFFEEKKIRQVKSMNFSLYMCTY